MINIGLVTPSDPVITDNSGNATLSCEFSSYLPRNPTFSWENSQLTIPDNSTRFSIIQSLKSGGTLTTSMVSTLIISSLSFNDSGNYTCKMRGDNNAELIGVAELTVISKPSDTSSTSKLIEHLYMIVFDYAVVPTVTTTATTITTTAATATATVTPVYSNSTTVVVAAVMSIVALVIAMLILVSGLSAGLCFLHKHRTRKHKQATPVEIVYDEVNTLEGGETDQVYENITDTIGGDPSSDVLATTNVAYGVTLLQPPENIDDKYYI